MVGVRIRSLWVSRRALVLLHAYRPNMYLDTVQIIVWKRHKYLSAQYSHTPPRPSIDARAVRSHAAARPRPRPPPRDAPRARAHRVSLALTASRASSYRRVVAPAPVFMSTPRRRSGGGRREARDASWMADEVDDANAVADARFSTVDRDYIGLRGGSEEDEEDDEDDDDEEGLLDVDDDDDSSDDSEEDSESESEDEDGGREGDEDDDDVEYSDSEEMALAVAMKAQKKRLDGRVRRDAVNAEDEDDDEDDDEDGDAGFGIKGKKKMDFYGDDDVDHEGLSDEEDRVEEEKEARRMRKLMAEEMRAEDFGVESDEDEDEDEDEDAKATLGAKAANLRRGDGKKASSASKASKKTSVSVETLTAEERAERLAAEDDATAANDAPELIALSKELTSTLASIEASVEPLVKAAKDGDFATEDGISYLDTKYLLMLSYCSSIVFYLLLKAEGRSVKDHPVIERLVEIRLYLEKLRPIDKKLQYQVRARLTTKIGGDSTSSGGRRVAVMQTLTRIGLTTH